MLNKKLFILSFVGCLFFLPANATLFKAEEFTLENGLHCVIIENHKAPIVKSMLWYKVGAIDENVGKGGAAHLLEHLMFRGTHRVPSEQFNRLMEENGVQANAFTSHDVTVYHEFADISRLELILALEADRMHNLAFSDDDFIAEQKIVFQERKERIENNPTGEFYERLRSILFNNSPYARPVTGKNEEIMLLTANDMRKFYHQYYAPNNAILVISGDINLAEAKPLIEKYFAKIPTEKVTRNKINDASSSFQATIEMSLPNVTSMKIEKRYLLPLQQELGTKNYAFLVLAEYLGGGETSALYKDLVIDKRIALSISASYDFVTRGNATFSLSILPQTTDENSFKETLAQLNTAMQNEIIALNEDKLAQVKRKMLADLVYVNDNPSNAANWVGYMLSAGFDLSEIQNYAEYIENVTLKQVKQAYNQLQNTPQITGILHPEKDISGEKDE